MGDNTKIEWTATVNPDGTTSPGLTFNPWVGCQKISPACDNCYAESWAKRSGNPQLWSGLRRRTTAANWRKLVIAHAAIPDGQRRRVFCASLADVFDNAVPQAWRDDLFGLIQATPRLDWLLLTKRIGNVKSMVPWYSYRGSMQPQYHFPKNVWLGITVVNQEEADRDIPKLLDIPAPVRFLSCEPLLGPINLNRVVLAANLEIVGPINEEGFDKINLTINSLKGAASLKMAPLDWVIIGGESGRNARPMEAQWAIDLIAQCIAVETPVFMKQGSQANWPDFKNFDSFPDMLKVRQWPETQ